MGKAHDIEIWRPDTRTAKRWTSKSLRSLSKSAHAWVLSVLRPYLIQNDVLNGVALRCEDKPSSERAVLSGHRRDAGLGVTALKEVVVLRSPPTVHVYDVESYGRR